MKSFTSKLISTVAFAALSTATLFAPLQASAQGGVSQGHGVKCYWVLVSFDPATGTSVYSQQCTTTP